MILGRKALKILATVAHTALSAARWIVGMDAQFRDRCKACDSSRPVGCWGLGGPAAAAWCPYKGRGAK